MGLFGKSKKEYRAEIAAMRNEHNAEMTAMRQKFEQLGGDSYLEIKQKTEVLTTEAQSLQDTISAQQKTIADNTDTVSKLNKQIETQKNKLRREKELYKAMESSINAYKDYDPAAASRFVDDHLLAESEQLAPTIMVHLHSMDSKSLNKAFRDNDKQIDSLLSRYSTRYTTKANRAIYELMVIALRSELQNILSNLKYDKLDTAINQVKAMTAKYLTIAGDGNQNIAGTLTKFIGEVEYLFINAVKIEYNYYVKREQAKQEQAELREQQKQEREERKALEQERKRVESEEAKYQNELAKTKAKLAEANAEEMEALKKRILDLESSLSSVATKKEEIANLAKGKAGYVYIISNVGSFGENVFKIGMTRRYDPEERVNELGSASVPFKFDVHSFIFSKDAVALEAALHQKFDDRRVNKVNLRKEFFRVSLDELENAVHEIDPTAEFRRVVPAEEYNQSLSSNESYTSTESDDSDDDDE